MAKRAPRYSEEEHWALQEAIKQLGPNWRKDPEGLKKSYDQILKKQFSDKHFSNRDGKALKAHWDTLIKKGPDNYPWTEEELEDLRRLHGKYGSDYSSIRYSLGTGRSVSAIKQKIREFMDENLLNPESPVLGLSSSTYKKSFSKVQRMPPPRKQRPLQVQTEEEEEEDPPTPLPKKENDRLDKIEETVDNLRQDFENVQTEMKEIKEALQGLLQVMNDAHKPQQNPQ